jgi:hypothetical protein
MVGRNKHMCVYNVIFVDTKKKLMVFVCSGGWRSCQLRRIRICASDFGHPVRCSECFDRVRETVILQHQTE